jgi:hypothetical protein
MPLPSRLVRRTLAALALALACTGTGYKFQSPPNMHYGLRVTADLGRDGSDAQALAGMGDIDLRPELGGFFNYFITNEWFLTTSFRYGADNDRNTQTDQYAAAREVSSRADAATASADRPMQVQSTGT